MLFIIYDISPSEMSDFEGSNILLYLDDRLSGGESGFD